MYTYCVTNFGGLVLGATRVPFSARDAISVYSSKMKVTGSHPQPLKRTGGENEDTKYYSSGTNKRKTTESLARAWGEKKPDLPHKVTETSTTNKTI